MSSGPQDDWMTCPYNKFHRMAKTSFYIHLTKCRRNYTGTEKYICPFNVAHRGPLPEKQFHMQTCPDKKHMERKVHSESLLDLIEQADARREEPTPQLPVENWDLGEQTGIPQGSFLADRRNIFKEGDSFLSRNQNRVVAEDKERQAQLQSQAEQQQVVSTFGGRGAGVAVANTSGKPAMGRGRGRGRGTGVVGAALANPSGPTNQQAPVTPQQATQPPTVPRMMHPPSQPGPPRMAFPSQPAPPGMGFPPFQPSVSRPVAPSFPQHPVRPPGPMGVGPPVGPSGGFTGFFARWGTPSSAPRSYEEDFPALGGATPQMTGDGNRGPSGVTPLSQPPPGLGRGGGGREVNPQQSGGRGRGLSLASVAAEMTQEASLLMSLNRGRGLNPSSSGAQPGAGLG